MKNHAIITNKKSEFELKPGSAESKIKLNGDSIHDSVTLHHKDRILFGEYIIVFRVDKQLNIYAHSPVHIGSRYTLWLLPVATN